MKRVLGSANASQKGWWSEYYDVVSAEELADNMCCDVKEIESSSASRAKGYNMKHVGWLYAKPEFEDDLDVYCMAELVSEGGETFVASTSGGRVDDIKDEVLDMVGSYDDEDDWE